MSAAESLFRKFGAVSFPLATTGDTSFAALDPGRDILLELLADALVSELTPVWTAATAGTPLAGTTPVTQKLPELPDLSAVQQVAVAFPLLAVSRTGDPIQIEEYTIAQDRLTSRWEVDYILGPLDIGNQIKLQDVLIAAAKIIGLTIHAGGHLAHETQESSGQLFAKLVLGEGDGCACFSTCRVVDAQIGSASLAEGGPKYHACTLTLETTELSGIVDGDGAAYDGTFATLQTGTESGMGLDVVINTSVPLVTE
jgi:hypothetical protein